MRGTGDFRCVTFSPDGVYFASGSTDTTINVWEVETGRYVGQFYGHKSSVKCISFAFCNNFFATGSADATVKLWNVHIGARKCIRTFKGHSLPVFSVVFTTPDDPKTLVSGSYDNTFKIWDAENGECSRSINLPDHAIHMALSPDGRLAALGTYQGVLTLWNLGTGEHVKTAHGHASFVMCVAYSSCGKFWASGSDDATVIVWNAQIGNRLKQFEGHKSIVSSVAFSPDGLLVASGSKDKTLKLWRVHEGDCLMSIDLLCEPMEGISFSPDGFTLVSGASGSSTQLYTTPIFDRETRVSERIYALLSALKYNKSECSVDLYELGKLGRGVFSTIRKMISWWE